MLFLLLFDGNIGYANAPQCYGIRTVVVLLYLLVIYDPILLLHSHMSGIFYLRDLVERYHPTDMHCEIRKGIESAQNAFLFCHQKCS
jgi:hypothetical protein